MISTFLNTFLCGFLTNLFGNLLPIPGIGGQIGGICSSIASAFSGIGL